MKVKYFPQRIDVQYKVEGETIYIKRQDKVFKVDFSSLLDDGKPAHPIAYISGAEKVNGELTVTLIQPLDKDGKEIPALGEFETEEHEEVEIEWKTWEEIEREENEPGEIEKLKQDNEMLAMAVMELSTFMLNGGK